jgi:hypothetical protein
MAINSEDKVLKVLTSRLDGINEAQRRSRIAFLLVILASGTVLTALWNTYLSWDRQWADNASAPKSWGQKKLVDEQIKNYSDTSTVNIPVLGIHVGVNDAAVLGSLVLFAFAAYLCTTLLRENHEIGSLLRQQKDAPEDVRQFIFYRIRALIPLGGMGDNDGPMSTLGGSERTAQLPLARKGIQFLLFAPLIVVLLIVASDLYFAFWFISAARHKVGPAWNGLSSQYRWQLAVSDTFALAVGIMTAIYCRFAAAYMRATNDIVEEFGHKLDQPATAEDKE